MNNLKKMNIKGLIFGMVMCCVASTGLRAQKVIDTWSFSTGVDTTLWYDISGVDSMLIAPGNKTSARSGLVSIGFDFTLGETTHTQFSTNINGTVRLGNVQILSSGGYSNALNQSNGPKIEPFGYCGRFDSTCYTRMALLGTAGNRVLVVETRMKDYNNASDSLYLSFQVQLFEAGGLRIVYGESDPGAVYNTSFARLQNGVSASLNNNNRDIIYIDFATHEAVRLNSTCSLYNTAELWPEKGRWYNLEPDASPCPYPGNITVVSNNPDSTVLSWPAVAGANYHLMIAEAGLNTILTDTFICITGMLNGGAIYNGTLQTMCADGSESYRVREFSFTTANGPVNSMPWTADFDNATAAANWNITLRADQISNWERRTLSGNGYMYSGAIDNSAYTADAWLISPAIQLPADANVPLMWDYRSLQSTNRYDTPVIDVMVAVCDTTDAIDTSAAAWTKLMTLEGLVPNYKTYCLSLEGYSGNRVRVAFARHGFCFGTAYIDNVRIGTADTLARIYAPLHPMVGDTAELRALYVGVDTIATPFNWNSSKHDNNEATMTARADSRVVDIVYATSGLDTITLQYGDRTDTLVVLVKDCATASNYPWRDDFENGTDCWTLPSDNRWYVHRYPSCAYDGSCYMRSKTNPATVHNRLLSNTFVMPSAADIAYLSLIFQARNTYANTDAHLSVYFALDSNNTETLLIDTVIGWNTYRQIIVPLSSLAGQTGHFVFEHWTSSTSITHDIYLDDVEVRYAANPVITHNIPDHAYVDDTNAFTATISEGSSMGLTYSWRSSMIDLGHADTIGNGHDGNLHIVYLSGGVDTIIATATNAYGSTSDTTIITICDPIDQFPWQADFNDRGCWYTADAQDWAIVNNYTVNHKVLSAWGDLSTQGTIALPTMQLPMDTTLTLEYKTRGNTVYSVLLTTGTYGTYDSVLYNGTITSGGTFAWQSISLGAYAGQRVRIAFSKPHNHDVIQIDSIIVRSHNYPIIVLEAPRHAFTDGAATATVRLTHGDPTTMVYQWHSTLLDTTVTQTSPHINLNYTTTGIDTISVVGTNNHGADSATAVTVVTTWDTLQAPCVVDDFGGGNLDHWYQDAKCSWQEYLGTGRSYWYNPTVDARIVSRAITVPSWADDSLVLEWKAAAESRNTAMRYYVLATTGDYTDYSQYDTLYIFDTVLNTAQVAWNIGRAGLGAYAGQTIHVAFVNHPTATFYQYDARALRLDDVQIINLRLPKVRIAKPSVAHSGEPTLVRAELVEGTNTGLSCTWHSTMATAGLATLTVNNDSLHIHYTSAGTDTIKVIATNAFGSDTAVAVVQVTECPSIATLPWTEDFNSVVGTAYNAEGSLPDCWRSYWSGSSAAYAPHVIGSYPYNPIGSYVSSSQLALMMLAGIPGQGSLEGIDSVAIVESPVIALPLNQHRLSFHYMHESANRGTLSVGYMRGGNFVSVADMPPQASGSTDTVSLGAFPADVHRFALRWTQGVASWYGVVVDNISLLAFDTMPTVQIGTPVVHGGDSVHFRAWLADGLADSLSYTWHSSMAAAGQATLTAMGDSACIVYTVLGTDTVSVTATNAYGVDTAQLLYTYPGAPDGVIGGPTSVHSDDTLTYAAYLFIGSTTSVSFSWQSTMAAAGQATMLVTGDTLRMVYLTGGTDTLTLITTNAFGVDTTRRIITVTNCHITTFPWTEGFENGMNSCWYLSTIPGSTTTNWSIRGEYWYAHSGSHYMYSPFATADGDNSSIDAWFILPPVEVPASSSLSLNFYANFQGNITTHSYPRLTVLVSTLGNATNYFTDTIYSEQTNTLDREYLFGSASLAAYAGQTVWIAFVHGNRNVSLGIDDISIDYSAVPVAGISGPTEQLSSEEAIFTAHLLNGDTTGITYIWHSTMADAGLATLTATDSTAAIEYHAGGTDHVSVVIANAAGSDSVAMTCSVTDCEPITQLPYTVRLNSNNNITCWQKDGGWYIGDYFSSGITCMQCLNWDFDPVDNWLVMREIAIPDDYTQSYTLRWHMQCNHSKYQVMVSTQGRSDHSLFDTLYYEQNDSTHWTSRTLSLDAYRGQNIYIAFRNLGWYNSPAHYSDMGVFRIDTIQVLVSSDPQTYRTLTLDVNDPTMGSVSGAGVYPDSSDVTISATPFEGYHFVAWNDNDTCTVRTLTLVSDTAFTAYFAADTLPTPPPDTLWRTVAVTANVDGVCETYGSGTYADSSRVEMGYTMVDTVTEGGHWQFLGWSDGENDNPRTILVTSDTTIVALFEWMADSVGINELRDNSYEIRVYPNPAHGAVTVSVGAPATLTVLDLTGRVVVAPLSLSSSATLPFTDLPSGTYFLRVTTEEGTAVKKLIVK